MTGSPLKKNYKLLAKLLPSVHSWLPLLRWGVLINVRWVSSLWGDWRGVGSVRGYLLCVLVQTADRRKGSLYSFIHSFMFPSSICFTLFVSFSPIWAPWRKTELHSLSIPLSLDRCLVHSKHLVFVDWVNEGKEHRLWNLRFNSATSCLEDLQCHCPNSLSYFSHLQVGKKNSY